MKTNNSRGSLLTDIGLDPETDCELGFYCGYIFDRFNGNVKHDVMHGRI